MEPVESVRFQRGDASLVCSVVPWDSETFGFTVGQIEAIDVGSGDSVAAVLGDFRQWAESVDARLVSCRLNHQQLGASMALEREGFRFVEMVFSPRMSLLQELDRPTVGVSIQRVAPVDVKLIADVAYSAFTTGRIALDSRLDPTLGHQRYADWVRRGAAAEGQDLLKVLLGDEIAGFFLVEPRDDGVIYWHLTALAPKWRGRGIALSVWQAMLQRHRDEGLAAVQTTISGHNLAVLNLYARLGFSFTSASMTFHWIADEPMRSQSSAARRSATLKEAR